VEDVVHAGPIAWAFEVAPNPSVLRLHVTSELTDETIRTCPPAAPPAPLALLLGLGDVRSLDLHRYRARVNLAPDVSAREMLVRVAALLTPSWGPPSALPPEEMPRAFVVRDRGPRTVAESSEMAGDHPLLAALFLVDGVCEAIAAEGLALVRLGRMFRWDEVEDGVREALATR
jgi:hypothetical protein